MKKLHDLGLYPIFGNYNPVPDDEIAKLESSRGYTLPFDYMQFIREYGDCGFSPSVVVRPIEPPPESVTDDGVLGITIFYGAEGERGGLLSMSKSTFTEAMPPTVIPIAASHGSSQFLLGIGGKDQNLVYFWEFEGWPDPEDYLEEGIEVPQNWQYSNMTLVARSFSDFLNRMERGTLD